MTNETNTQFLTGHQKSKFAQFIESQYNSKITNRSDLKRQSILTQSPKNQNTISQQSSIASDSHCCAPPENKIKLGINFTRNQEGVQKLFIPIFCSNSNENCGSVRSASFDDNLLENNYNYPEDDEAKDQVVHSVEEKQLEQQQQVSNSNQRATNDLATENSGNNSKNLNTPENQPLQHQQFKPFKRYSENICSPPKIIQEPEISEEIYRALLICHQLRKKIDPSTQQTESYQFINEDQCILEYCQKKEKYFESDFKIMNNQVFSLKVNNKRILIPILNENERINQRNVFSILVKSSLETEETDAVLYSRGFAKQFIQNLNLSSDEQLNLSYIVDELKMMGFSPLIYATKEISEAKTVQFLKQIRIVSNMNDYQELSQLYDQLEQKSNFLCLLILRQELKQDAIAFLQNQKQQEITPIFFYEQKEEAIYLLNSYVEFIQDNDEKLIFNIDNQEDTKILIKRMLVKFRKIQNEKINTDFNQRNSYRKNSSPIITTQSPQLSALRLIFFFFLIQQIILPKRPEREEIPKYYYI